MPASACAARGGGR
ncbi:hypothetical protein YPPY06_4760, partial [Yersinia pestis PY-06]